jgi:putative membrane protein
MVPGVVAIAAGVSAYAATWWLLLAAVAALLRGRTARPMARARSRRSTTTWSPVGRHRPPPRGLHTLDRVELPGPWFQRRAGLTDLVATTADGRQRVRVLDLDVRHHWQARRPACPSVLARLGGSRVAIGSDRHGPELRVGAGHPDDPVLAVPWTPSVVDLVPRARRCPG